MNGETQEGRAGCWRADREPDGRRSELGEFAEALGVSAGALGNYIRGDREPSFEFLVQVGRVTGADMNWLVMGVEEGGDAGARGRRARLPIGSIRSSCRA